MKILVCVKEVPDLDPDSELSVDEQGTWYKEDETIRFMMNRFDEFAVEEALQIKEVQPETTIDAITVGPERSHSVLRRALGMGADNGLHIVTETAGYLDPFDIASLIAKVAREKKYDLILTGVMSEDTQQGQTGVMIAEILQIPWATSVISRKLSAESNSLVIEREVEGGFRDVFDIDLPCLLTLQSGVNQPRYPALSKVLRAKKAELESYKASELSEQAELQTVVAVDHPQKERTGQRLEGTSSEKAQRLLTLLKEKSFLK